MVKDEGSLSDGFRKRALPRRKFYNISGLVHAHLVMDKSAQLYDSGPKKQPKHKVFGRDIPDIRDPDVGISRTKTLCKWPFSVVLDREWPACPGVWVGTSRIWKNFMQENFGLIFCTLMIILQSKSTAHAIPELLQDSALTIIPHLEECCATSRLFSSTSSSRSRPLFFKRPSDLDS